jgi:hypothetical protein
VVASLAFREIMLVLMFFATVFGFIVAAIALGVRIGTKSRRP